MRNIYPFLICCALALTVVLLSGCTNSKKAAKTAKKTGTDSGNQLPKPEWLKVDDGKLPKMSQDETLLENGLVSVFEPDGWKRLARVPRLGRAGYKPAAAFQKGENLLIVGKGTESKNLPNFDKNNIEEFAEGFQKRFNEEAKMVQLGDWVGVLFTREVKNTKRIGKMCDRKIVATAINGSLYTYELMLLNGDKIDDDLQNTLFAVVSNTVKNKSNVPVGKLLDDDRKISASPELEEKDSGGDVPIPIEGLGQRKKTEPETAEPLAEKAEPLEEKQAPKKEPKEKPKKETNTKDALDHLKSLLG